MPHALVTGAGSGIGRAVALRLSSLGYQVSLLGRRREALEETAGLVAEAGGSAEVHPCDVTDQARVKDAVAAAVEAAGSIDVLINNAGMSGRSEVADGDLDFFDRVLRTNLYGPFLVSSEVVSRLPDKTGRVINIGSILSKIGVAGYTAYCSSKHGLVGFTRALALELAPRGITVNCICPGWTDTAMAEQGVKETAEAMGMSADDFWIMAKAQVPTGRSSSPEEIAGLVAYLVSAEAGNLTAQTLVLDGGSVQN